MPGFDGTGPRGIGSGSGWGRGPCAAIRRQGFRRDFTQPLLGQRSQTGSWGRPCWGRRYISGFGGPGQAAGGYEAPVDEVQSLKERQACLQEELVAIQNQLERLESRT
jgi:hypothetical protein